MKDGRRCASGVRLACAVAGLWVGIGGIAARVEAQIPPCNHGVSIFKTCNSPKRSCLDNASCNDTNECTLDVCPTDLDNKTDCFLTLGHADTCGDTTRINQAFDTQDTAGDAVRVPAVGNLPIVQVTGNAVCCGGAVPAAVFPCFVGPAGAMRTIPGAESGCGDISLPGTGTAGAVTAQQNTYVIQADDPNPLPDLANWRTQDRCDDPMTVSCNPQEATQQFPASTLLQGCSNPFTPESTPCIGVDDGNECTTAGCNGMGVCNQSHILDPDSTPCTDTDDNTCTTAGCTAAGVCNQSHILCTTTTTSSLVTTTTSTTSTTPPGCPDGTLQPPETCEPPGAPQPPNNNVCRGDCTFCGDGIVNGGNDPMGNPLETCDDGNNVDGSCIEPRDECRNNCTKTICRDPARIRLFQRRPDEFRVHALINPDPSSDPSTAPVTVELSNANGLIYRETIPAGTVIKNGETNFRHRDRDARTRGGFAFLQVLKRSGRASSIKFKTYGDLSGATLPQMRLAITIGNEVFTADSEWKKLPNGWHLAFVIVGQ